MSHHLIVAGVVATAAALVVAIPFAIRTLLTARTDETHTLSRRDEALQGGLMALFGAGLLSCMVGVVLEQL